MPNAGQCGKMEDNAEAQIANQGGEGLAQLGNLWVVIVLHPEVEGSYNFHGSRMARATSLFASASSTNCSFTGSHFSARRNW